LSYLVDTNVLSELARTRPATAVVAWFAEVAETQLYLSVLSLGELRRGVERLPAGKRQEGLRRWLEHGLPERFESRLLPIDAAVSERWGRLCAESPRTLPAIDGLLAATALHHDLRIVTRNERDFADTGVTVVNPWR
jgi:predicted nucleic acid-binding protein